MAVRTTHSDDFSMNAIMDAEANILQGMARFMCTTFVPGIKALVPTPSRPTADEVSNQVAQLKTILCGFTAKECAMADVIKAVAKKEAADMGVDPCEVCECERERKKKCEKCC